MACAHEQFKTVSEVKAREGFGFDVRLFVQCAQCGSPLRFAPAAGVRVENRGLIAVVVGEMAGD